MLMCSVYMLHFQLLLFQFFGYCARLYTLVQLDLLHGVHDDAGNVEKDGFFHAASTARPIVKMKNVNEFERKVTKSNNSVNRPMSSQSSHYFKRNV